VSSASLVGNSDSLQGTAQRASGVYPKIAELRKELRRMIQLKSISDTQKQAKEELTGRTIERENKTKERREATIEPQLPILSQSVPRSRECRFARLRGFA
jgi:hypothetical protein